MPQLKMTSKGQITINKALREGLGARPGEKLNIEVRADGGIIIAPVQRRTRTWDDIVGLLKRPGQPVLTIEEIKDATERAWAGER